MSDLLQLENVTAGYAGNVVLEDVSLSLPANASIALLGRNGVGKTTLLATIMGLTRIQSGRVMFGGVDLATVETHQRAERGIGYVPQEREIFKSLTVEENLMVAARRGRWTVARVYELFPRLAERRSHMGNQISGGEQQMLSIGRALMGNPLLLLLDEPLEGLAPIIVELLLTALQRLIREESLTVVLVEQSAKLALGVTDDALVLSRGRIVHYGNSAELLADPERLASLVVAAA